jgi:hypothetical protein
MLSKNALQQIACCGGTFSLAPGWAPVRVRKTRESENLEFAFRFNRNASSSAIVNSFDRVQHRARHATYPCHVARRSDMSIGETTGHCRGRRRAGDCVDGANRCTGAEWPDCRWRRGGRRGFLGTLSSLLSLLSFRLLRGSGLGARPVLGTLRERLLSSGRFDGSSWAPRARL